MSDDEKSVGDEEVAPPRLSKMALLIIAFSAALGVLFLALLGGGVYFVKKTNSLQAELVSARKEIKGMKEKVGALEELPARIAALAHQFDELKVAPAAVPAPEAPKPAALDSDTKAVAGKSPQTHGDSKEKHEIKAGAAKSDGHAPNAAHKEPVAEPAKASLRDNKPVVTGKPAALAPGVEPVLPKRAPVESFSCDIVGKSAEEQAAILKRCVGVMDAPPPKSKAAGK